MKHTTRNSRLIKAPAEKIYNALTTPEGLKTWQVPGKMTAEIHSFDLRPGGGYQMSLFYPANEGKMKGKTGLNEDRFTAKFVELDPPKKIVESVLFDTNDPKFTGEMIMEIILEPISSGTNVTFTFKNIPTGVKPEDNEAGTISSLEKLAHYVESRL